MKYACILWMLLWSMSTQAQVRGVVKDKTGEPLPGANVSWLHSAHGVTTSQDGSFSIHKASNSHLLVISFIGFRSDTIRVSGRDDMLEVILQEGVELAEVNVTSRRIGTMKLRSSVMNEDMISSAELTRAACCNLGESFVTNPSVDVNYSDAATGAKQIQLLGLSGTYVQLLTENMPNYRGASAPYGLGYVPGPWMESIQVSKGISSVKNGYEAITGQINVEFKKPQNPEADWVSVNLFGASTGRFEANSDATFKIDKRWSTSLLAHYENENKLHDANGDGFADIPRIEQYNLWNRWVYMGDRYVFQAGVKALGETRNGGQSAHHQSPAADPYEIGIDSRRYELFAKNAYVFDKEKNTNMALILSSSWHNQDSFYGRKIYDVEQTNLYASLLFETELGQLHKLSAGLSFNYDGYDQRYRLSNDATLPLTDKLAKESVPGGYMQYTLSLNEQLTWMVGLRADYSNRHGFFMTPRTHIKYTPNEFVHFRLSAGKGYRSGQVLAENNYLLAGSRKVSGADDLRQEEAWNYGFSVSGYIPLWGKTLTLNGEYYYTDFINQWVIDMDSDPHEIAFRNLDGRSFSHVFQVEANYPCFDGFTLTAAYRRTDVRSTYGGIRLEKPLTSKYKGLITASYQPGLGKWQFDATYQLNGGGRMPTPYVLPDGSQSWASRFGSFGLLSAQVTRYFRRWSVYIGGENLTNFKQKNPIIDASNPWGNRFDPTMIWGPIHGAKAYIGFRFNWERS